MICFQIGDPRSVVKKWTKSRKITKFGLTFAPLQIFGEAPETLKPVVDTPFQGLLLGKVWTTTPDPKGVKKIPKVVEFYLCIPLLHYKKPPYILHPSYFDEKGTSLVA